MSTLVIVESPAKAKTIKKYLGSGYDVVASMGHVRDLPQTRLGVKVSDNFKPQYALIKGKEKLVDELKAKASKNDNILLATDPDREGEAISWHLAYILNMDVNDTNRVTFNEITKTGIENGMAHPRTIDMDLVNAQQARRILDRLVGYKLSPFLSQKIRRGLSGGRVQSVAVRIIVDRENEIHAFKPEEYWTIDGKFAPAKGTSRKQFAASLYGTADGQKLKISSQEESDKILMELKDADYIVTKVKKGTRRKNPAPPFTTSTLQQEASRRLGFTARRTMKAAQELYEGIEIGDMGAVGLITYMRTDSLRLSEDAISAASAYIEERWGKKYLPDTPRHYKTKANAQDGHEAIRPSTPSISPDKVKENLTGDQYKLYKLIWERFIACQMSNCLQATTQAEITAGNYLLKASGYTVTFDGYTVLYEEKKDTEEEASDGTLPPLEKDMPLRCKEIKGSQHFTQPPARYTEASLIKALEENGIGRPSTYATTIGTILNREYVVRDGKALKPTELGEVTTKLMKERFPKVVNVKFTAQVENELDEVQNGKVEWVQAVHDFYDDFAETLKVAKEEMKDVKIQLKEDVTDVICEKCGRHMVIKMGRYGKFLACPGYPECKNIKKYVEKNGAKCPKCGGDVVIKRTKKGRIFYGCENYPKCDFVSWDEPTKELCPKCGKTLLKKKGKNPKFYCVTPDCGYERIGEDKPDEEESN
ncbi:MAG: type I DNA topoisomerase [Oscillospiraceae bacterium]|nr:type I DNA topoisomerase [Oscillospiraceae bacterium]